MPRSVSASLDVLSSCSNKFLVSLGLPQIFEEVTGRTEPTSGCLANQGMVYQKRPYNKPIAGPSQVADDYELPKKRIIVCCDGTWNDSVSSNSPLTNVSRISRLITAVDVYGMQQIVSYHTGIGSGTSKLGNILDGMSGRGMLYQLLEIHHGHKRL